jgi:transposase-like protein
VALKVVTMPELRREVLLEAQRTGEPVSSICQRFGISRQTYYRYAGIASNTTANTPASSSALASPRIREALVSSRPWTR